MQIKLTALPSNKKRNICICLSKNLHCLHNQANYEKLNLKIICMLQEKFMGPVIGERSFKSTKSMHHIICLAIESLKILVSISQFD